MAEAVPLGERRRQRAFGPARDEGDAQLFEGYRRDRGFVVPTERGKWSVFESKLWRWEGSTEEGDYVQMAEVPEVLGRVVDRDIAGEVIRLRFLLRFSSGSERLASIDDVRSGDVWSQALVAAPGEPHVCQVLATAVSHLAEDAPEIAGTAEHVGGFLQLPPKQIRPSGYGDVAETGAGENERELWEEAGWAAVMNPNLALVLGAAWAGLFIDRIGWLECPWLHLLDDTSRGKTSSLRLAAALVGDPRAVLRPMNFTSIGLSTRLGELGCLPGFFDELGATGVNAQQLEALTYRIAGGASRLTGTRDGRTRETAPFRSIILTSGNATLAHVTESPGLVARVIEITTPMLLNGWYAKRISEIAHLAYGWPLAWINGELDARAFETWRQAYRGELGQVDGLLGRIADSLSLFLAGAQLLGELLGVDELGDKAVEAATTLLDGVELDLEERGKSMGDRVLEALLGEYGARPFAFPHEASWEFATRDVEGMRIDATTVCVLPAALRRIAREAGIDDLTPGLRQLAEVGVLRPGSRGHLQRRRRIGSKPIPFYEFKIPAQMADEGRARPARAKGPQARAVYPQLASLETGLDQASSDPVDKPRAPRAPRAPKIVRSRARETLIDELHSMSGSRLRELAFLADEREQADELARAGRLAAVLDRPALGAYLQPKIEPIDQEAAMPLNVLPSQSPELVLTESAGRLVALGDRSHTVTLFDGSTMAELLDFAELHGSTLVWVTLAAAVKLGGAGLCYREDEPLGTPADWNMRHTSPGRWFAFRAGVHSEGIHVIWGPADQGPFSQLPKTELVDALADFREAHSITWPGSGGASFAAMLRASHAGVKGRAIGQLGASIEPALVTDGQVGESGLDWLRPSTSDEGPFLHAYDRNGAFLAVLGETRWGLGVPSHFAFGAGEPFKATERRPGWWCVKVPANWPSGLPELVTAPRGRKQSAEASVWITTPTAVFIAKDLGLELLVVHAWVWQDSIAYLRTLQGRLRDARRSIVRKGGAGTSSAVYDAHKAVYSEGVNWWRANFHRDHIEERGGLAIGPTTWRPNAQAQVAALARVNLTRAANKGGQKSGIWPVAALRVDEIIYRSPLADPREAAAAIGLKIGNDLGQFKVAGTIGVDERRLAGKGGLRWIEAELHAE